MAVGEEVEDANGTFNMGWDDAQGLGLRVDGIM
jgi:hypothetical protein